MNHDLLYLTHLYHHFIPLSSLPSSFTININGLSLLSTSLTKQQENDCILKDIQFFHAIPFGQRYNTSPLSLSPYPYAYCTPCFLLYDLTTLHPISFSMDSNDPSSSLYLFKYNADESFTSSKAPISYTHSINFSTLNSTSPLYPYTHYTLSSSLVNGLDTLFYNEKFGFIHQQSSTQSYYLLPLLSTLGDMNIIDGPIYFYCIRPVFHCDSFSINRCAKDYEQTSTKTTTIPTFKDQYIYIHTNNIGLIQCTEDYLIVHSTTDTLEYSVNGYRYLLSPYKAVYPNQSKPFIVYTQQTMDRVHSIENAIRYNYPLLIEGITASGKTFSTDIVSIQSGLPLIRYNFSPSSSIENLFGDITIHTIDGKSHFVFKEGAFSEAFINGYLLLLDEMSLAPSSIIQAILTTIESKQIYLDKLDSFCILPMNPNFRIIATQNPAGTDYKREPLIKAIKDHFRCITSLTDSQYSEILKEKIKYETSKNSTIHITENDINNILLNHDLQNLTIKKQVKNKIYTIRDINRILSLYSYSHLSLESSMKLIYNWNMPSLLSSSFNVTKLSFEFVVPLVMKTWSSFFYNIEYLLRSGCNILIHSKNEFIARKYVYGYLYWLDHVKNTNTYKLFYCNHGIESEQLIGNMILQQSENPSTKQSSFLPVFVESSLLQCIREGKICFFQNLGYMDSNCFERLNPILEKQYSNDLITDYYNSHYFDDYEEQERKNSYETLDYSNPTIRIDELKEDCNVHIHPNFRCIATCSTEELNNFSPALHNRFALLKVDEQIGKETQYMIPNTNIDPLFSTMIDEKWISPLSSMNYYEQKTILNGLQYISTYITLSDKRQLMNDYLNYKLNGTNYSIFEDVYECRRKEYSSILTSFFENRCIMISGPSCSGKSTILNDILNRLNLLQQSYVYHFTNECDISKLIGSYSLSCNENSTNNGYFNQGPLLESVLNGSVFVIDHYETLDVNLKQALESFIDPFNNVIHYENIEKTIHPSFRMVLLNTVVSNTALNENYSCYIPSIPINYLSTDSHKLTIPMLNLLYNTSYNTNEKENILTSLRLLLVIQDIYQCEKNHFEVSDELYNNPDFECLLLFLLYHDPSNLYQDSKVLLNYCSLYSRLYPSVNINDTIGMILSLMQSSIQYDDSKNMIIHSFCSVEFPSSLSPLPEQYHHCSWFLDALFKYSLIENIYDTNPEHYKVPIMMIGTYTKNEFLRYLHPTIDSIEFSRSMTIDSLVGTHTIATTEQLQSYVYALQLEEKNERNTTAQYDHWLKTLQELINLNQSSVMYYKPGYLSRHLLEQKDVLLNNYELLSEELFPRINELLTNQYLNLPYNLYEYNNHCLLPSSSIHIYASQDAITQRPYTQTNGFMYISLQDYSIEEKNLFFPSLARTSMDLPYHLLRIIESITSCFKYPETDSLFYVMYFSTEKYQRKNIIQKYPCSSSMKSLFTSKNDELCDPSLYDSIFTESFSSDVYNAIQSFINDPVSPMYPTLTTILITISILLSYYSSYHDSSSTYHFPVILEGLPGVGKTDIARRVFLYLNHQYSNSEMSFSELNPIFSSNQEILSFSQTKDVTDIFGRMSITTVNSIFIPTKLSLLLNPLLDDSVQQFIQENHVKFDNSNRIIYLCFDELNLSTPELLDELSILIHCSCEQLPYCIPGTDIKFSLPRIVFVITQNPASMSVSRGLLPQSIIKNSIMHKDICFSEYEIITISNHIIEPYYKEELYQSYEMNQKIIQDSQTQSSESLLQYEQDRLQNELQQFNTLLSVLISTAIKIGEETSIPFTLRDTYKIQSLICHSKCSVLISLWLVISSKFPPEKRIPLNTLLNINETSKITISYNPSTSELVLNSSFNNHLYVKQYLSDYISMVTQEKFLFYQLIFAYQSKRSIIIYGPSPSGKSYVVSQLCHLLGDNSYCIPINPDSDISVLVGKNHIKDDSSMKNEKQAKHDLIEFREGPLLEAMKNGRLLIVDGIQNAKGDILELLNPLTEENPHLYISETKTEYVSSLQEKNSSSNQVVIHEDFRLIMLLSSSSLSSVPLPLQSRCILLSTSSLNTFKNAYELCCLEKQYDCPIGNYLNENNPNHSNFRSILRLCNNYQSIEEDYRIEFNEDLPEYSSKKRVKIINDERFISQFLFVLQQEYNENRYEELCESIKDCLSQSVLSFSSEEIKFFNKLIKPYQSTILYYPLYYMNGILHSSFKYMNNNFLKIEQDMSQNHLSSWLLFYRYPFHCKEGSEKDKKQLFSMNQFKANTKCDQFILCYIFNEQSSFFSTLLNNGDLFASIYQYLFDNIDKIENYDDRLLIVKNVSEVYNYYNQIYVSYDEMMKKKESKDTSNMVFYTERIQNNNLKIKQSIEEIDPLFDANDSIHGLFSVLLQSSDEYLQRSKGEYISKNGIEEPTTMMFSDPKMELYQRLYGPSVSKENMEYLQSHHIYNDHSLLSLFMSKNEYNYSYIYCSYALYLYYKEKNPSGLIEVFMIELFKSFGMDSNKIKLSNIELCEHLIVLLEYYMNYIVSVNHLKLFEDLKCLQILSKLKCSFYIHHFISNEQLYESFDYFYDHQVFSQELIKYYAEKLFHIYDLSKKSLTREQIHQISYSLCEFSSDYKNEYHPIFYVSTGYHLLECVRSRNYDELLSNERSLRQLKALTKYTSIDVHGHLIENTDRFQLDPGSVLLIKDIQTEVLLSDTINESSNNTMEINEIERIVLQSSLMREFKFQLLFPYFFTSESLLIRSILEDPIYCHHMNEILKDCKTLDDVFDHLCSFHKVYINKELIEKKSELSVYQDQLKNLNDQKTALYKSMNQSELELKEEIENHLQQINKENEKKYQLYQNNQHYLNVYLTQFYHYSWNQFMNTSIVKKYDTIDSYHYYENLLSIWNINNEYYTTEEPIGMQYLKVVFIPFKPYHLSIQFKLKLYYHNKEQLAPIQFGNHLFTFECKPIKKTQYINYIMLPMPFTTYDCRVSELDYSIDEKKKSMILSKTWNESVLVPRYRYVSIDHTFTHISTSPKNIMINTILDYMYTMYNENSSYSLKYKLDSFDPSLFAQYRSLLKENSINLRYMYNYENCLPIFLYENAFINDRYVIESSSFFCLPHSFGYQSNSTFICSPIDYQYEESEDVDMKYKLNIKEIKILNTEDVLIKDHEYIDMIQSKNEIEELQHLYFYRYSNQSQYDVTDQDLAALKKYNAYAKKYIDLILNISALSTSIEKIQAYIKENDAKELSETVMYPSSFTESIYNTIYHGSEDAKRMNIPMVDESSVNQSIHDCFCVIVYEYYDYQSKKIISMIQTPLHHGIHSILVPDHYSNYHTNDLFIPVYNPQNLKIEAFSKDCNVIVCDNGLLLSITMQNIKKYYIDEEDIHYYDIPIVLSVKKTMIELHILFKSISNINIVECNPEMGLEEGTENNPILYVDSKSVSIYSNNQTRVYKESIQNSNGVFLENTNYRIQFNQRASHLSSLFYLDNNNKLHILESTSYMNSIYTDHSFDIQAIIHQFMNSNSLSSYINSLSSLSLLYLSKDVRDVLFAYNIYNNIYQNPSIHPIIKQFIKKYIIDVNTSNRNLLRWSNKTNIGSYAMINDIMIDNSKNYDKKGLGSKYILQQRIQSSEEILKNSNQTIVSVQYGQMISSSLLKEIESKLNQNIEYTDQFIDMTTPFDTMNDMESVSSPKENKYNESLYHMDIIRKASSQVYQQYADKSLDELIQEIFSNVNDPIYCGLTPLKCIDNSTYNPQSMNEYLTNNKENENEYKYLLLYKPIVHQWTTIIRSSHYYTEQYEYRSCMNMIIDCNFTHKTKKSRLRTIFCTILMLVCNELGIDLNIYSTGSRNQLYLLSTTKDDIKYKLLCINTISSLKKAVSTPLDAFKSKEFVEKIKNNEGFVIVSDCFSSQLLTTNQEIQSFISTILPNLFVCQIVPDRIIMNDECIDEKYQNQMNESLQKNFKRHLFQFYIQLNSIEKNDEFIQLFYSDKKLSNKYTEKKAQKSKRRYKPKNFDLTYDLDLDLSSIILTDYCVFPYESKELLQKIESLPVIQNDDLSYSLPYISNTIMDKLNSIIKDDNLFDSMNTLFSPNKATKYIPSMTGNIINLNAFIDYIITNISNGKLFKKKLGHKIRNYSVSIVIDGTVNAFSFINRNHSLNVLLRLLKAFQLLSVTSFDIWISKDTVIKIGSGLSPEEIWNESTLYYIIQELHQPVQTSCLYETMKQALATCSSRPMNSSLFVLTNGVRNEEQQNLIKRLIYSYNRCEVFAVGLGLYCQSYMNIFPIFVWCSNMNHLSQCIMNNKKSTNNQICQTQYKSSANEMMDIYDHTVSLNISPFISQTIQTQYSEIDIRSKFFNHDNIYLADHNIDGNEHDLGVDGSFKDFRILFIILYTTRKSNIDEDNKQKDIDITQENLRNGPIKKMQEKGFTCKDVYNYYEAINELRTGLYRVCCITCSCGDGYLGNSEEKSAYFDYVEAFIHALVLFNSYGGGIVWMLENYPYTFEAELFFKAHPLYNIDQLVDTTVHVEGGCFMKRETEYIRKKVQSVFEPQPGYFTTTGCIDFSNSVYTERLDQGLIMIYEGKTLAVLQEKVLVEHGMKVFARETNGDPTSKNKDYRYPAIMVKESVENYGRMIIDTAASKLFMEWKEDGTPRYISNALIWCLNLNRLLRERNVNVNYDLSHMNLEDIRYLNQMKEHEDKEFKKKEYIPKTIEKLKTMIVTFIVDLTGSTSPIKSDLESSLSTVIKEMEERRVFVEEKNKSKVKFLVVGYRDYNDLVPIVNTEIIDSKDYKSIISFLKSKDCNSLGGRYKSCLSSCEDICGGIQRAIDILKDYHYYEHTMIICGASGMHGCTGCRAKGDPHGRSFDSIWEGICNEIAKFNSIHIHAFGIDCSAKVVSMTAKKVPSEVSLFKESMNETFKTKLKHCRKGNTICDLSPLLIYHSLNNPKEIHKEFQEEINQLIKDAYTYDQRIS